jgi:hypothetical protein
MELDFRLVGLENMRSVEKSGLVLDLEHLDVKAATQLLPTSPSSTWQHFPINLEVTSPCNQATKIGFPKVSQRPRNSRPSRVLYQQKRWGFNVEPQRSNGLG